MRKHFICMNFIRGMLELIYFWNRKISIRRMEFFHDGLRRHLIGVYETYLEKIPLIILAVRHRKSYLRVGDREETIVF